MVFRGHIRAIGLCKADRKFRPATVFSGWEYLSPCSFNADFRGIEIQVNFWWYKMAFFNKNKSP